MGNRAAWCSVSAIVLILVAVAVFMLVPRPAEARGLRPDIIKRLCERQAKLMHRLHHPIVNPALCGEDPEPEPEEPTLTLIANPLSIMQGSTTTLTWNSEHADSCAASGGWSGNKALDGSEVVTPSASTTYTLTCIGEGGSVSASVSVSVMMPTPQPTLEFTATPSSMTNGATSTLSWISSNATSCTASGGWTGSRALSGTLVVSPATTTLYTLECVGEGGSVSKDVTVMVVLPDAPGLTFTAAPTAILAGASSTLSWLSTNATSCAASGGWSGSKALSDSQVVAPQATTTYELSCSGPGGTVQKSVTVNVTHPVPTVVLSALPLEVVHGATTTLSWTSSHATSCEAFEGWSGVKATSGSQVVTVTATTTYQLDCEGPGGVGGDSVTVTVTPQPVQGAMVITEVLYDLTTSTTSPQGQETANEWVEIFNGTNASINLSGWLIGDASTTDALPNVSLSPGAFAVITGSATTSNFWTIPQEAMLIVLSTPTIGNGLRNDGDAVRLINTASTTVDAVNWGFETSAFSPSISPGAEGHSIARKNNFTDTDTASDWETRVTPTPGQ